MPPKLVFETADFRCKVHCAQCDHVKPGGQRCKNRVCYGTPTCWVHSASRYGVKIGVSTVPGAGRGLFAARAFAKNAWICPYLGEKVAQACLDTRYPGDMTAPYAEALPGRRGVVDAACRRGIGAMANAKFRNAEPRTCLALSAHNAVSSFRTGTQELWLKSTKNIAKGAEIFHYYGSNYRLEDNHTTKRATGNDTRPC